MITMQQDRYNLENINQLLEGQGIVEFSMDSDSVDDDIQKIEGYLTNNKYKSPDDKKNMENILRYLKRLKSRIDNSGNFELSWSIEDYEVSAYPFSLREFPAYTIRSTDYIKNDSGKSIVKVSYDKVFEVIAFDMMYRDLGFELTDIEEHLGDVGILSINNSSILNRFIEQKALEASKCCRIEDCPYATVNGNLSWDYFNTAVKSPFTSKRYKDCVGRSVNTAIAVVLRNALQNLNNKSVKYKLCAVNEDGLYFMMKTDGLRLNEIFESVVIRTFGRRFEVNPTITVY